MHIQNKASLLKLSLAPVSLARTIREENLDFDAYLAWCAESGFDAVDLPCPTKYGWFWRDFEAQYDEVPDLFVAHGLEPGAFCCGNNFARADRGQFEAELEIVIAAIEYASGLGCRILRLFGGVPEGPRLGGEPGMTVTLGFERVIEGLERALPAAERHGVVLTLENHGALPGHSWELAALIRRFQSPHLRCAFDCANFIAANMPEIEDPIGAYEKLKEFIDYVHVKDFGAPVIDKSRRVEACLMGEGHVPLRQLLYRIVSGGFAGLFSIEYEASRVVPEKEGVRANVRFFRQIEADLAVLGILPREVLN